MDFAQIAGWINNNFMPITRFVKTSRGAQDKGNAVRLDDNGKLDNSLLHTGTGNGLDADTVDGAHYEVGDWPPTLTFGGGNTGITYNVAGTGGRYTRIGNQVWLTGRLTLTNKGSSTGNALIGGLPFVNGTGQAFVSPFSVMTTGLTLTAAYDCKLLLTSAAQNLLMYESGGGNATLLTNTHFNNNSSIYMMGHYRVA